jgi:IS30 family transposase
MRDIATHFIRTHSQRGLVTNKNINGPIREYMPKSTDILRDQGIMNLTFDSMDPESRKMLVFPTSRRKMTSYPSLVLHRLDECTTVYCLGNNDTAGTAMP